MDDFKSRLLRLLDAYTILPFNKHERKYFYVIQTLLDQQLTMYKSRTHTIKDRIVNLSSG